ncbi:type II toxin-antitoxin system RnlA family toxin [Thalassolituus sp.]|uniref:type II toxin-antitoxin system RnlA family toxin n=1 Tax=Thalassolituus sp. TaxID=2030822 RepID=UPI00398210D1
MSDYKDLNLNREALDANIQRFLELNGHQLDGQIQNSAGKKRVVFGSVGAEFAMVDLFLNNTGTTTINWKLGKNKPLGEILAIHLKSTIDPAEFEQVNYSLKGITTDAFEPILSCVTESDDIEINVLRDEVSCKHVTLKSVAHQDQLTLIHHRGTRVLQIQGKPLSCYRRVIFMLTDLLDLKGLEQVLYRKDESSAEIVRPEMAEDYLKNLFPTTYEALPEKIRRLIISGCCIKLASPKLPDYCLLLYPDLRALEGVLKALLSEYGMSVAQEDNKIGTFFDNNKGICTLKQVHSAQIPNSKMVDALNKGYSFYIKHRHTLFHMEEFTGASSMIDSLKRAVDLSKDAYAAINSLYVAKLGTP